jgi:hypothetical protein
MGSAYIRAPSSSIQLTVLATASSQKAHKRKHRESSPSDAEHHDASSQAEPPARTRFLPKRISVRPQASYNPKDYFAKLCIDGDVDGDVSNAKPTGQSNGEQGTRASEAKSSSRPDALTLKTSTAVSTWAWIPTTDC